MSNGNIYFESRFRQLPTRAALSTQLAKPKAFRCDPGFVPHCQLGVNGRDRKAPSLLAHRANTGIQSEPGKIRESYTWYATRESSPAHGTFTVNVSRVCVPVGPCPLRLISISCARRARLLVAPNHQNATCSTWGSITAEHVGFAVSWRAAL